MPGLEGISSSQELSFEAKTEAFKAAVNVLFKETVSEGRWKTEAELDRVRLEETGRDFYDSLLGLKKEGRWSSREEALTGINFEAPGLGYGAVGEERMRAVFDFLETQGLTEEELRREQEERQRTETGKETREEGQGRNQEDREREKEETQGGNQTRETQAKNRERQGERKEGRRGGSRRWTKGERRAYFEAERAAREEGDYEKLGLFYEPIRRDEIIEFRGLDSGRVKDSEIELRELLKDFKTNSRERRQQYLTLVLGELLKSGSYIEKQRMGFLQSDNCFDSPEGTMFEAVGFIQKCQGVCSGTEDVETLKRAMTNPGVEIMKGLEMLKIRLKLRVELKDGRKDIFEGEISPYHAMDLMDTPRWFKLMMDRNYDKEYDDPGYFKWRGEFMDELFRKRLKGRTLRDEEGKPLGLPEDAKIVESNLYDFALKVRIDAESEQTENVRELIANDLWWLHNTAWYVFVVGGRQRVWDKSLTGRWAGLPALRRPLLPANYEGIKYNSGLWQIREFYRTIQWYDFWSEQADYVLPLFWARAEERKVIEGEAKIISRKLDEKEREIITRKVRRRGALPHLIEEESKIALGLGEYTESSWYENARTWLNDPEHITCKGEMRSFEEIRKVPWTEEEKRAIRAVNFLPALKMMRQSDPGVVIDEERIRGYDGFCQVTEQLSYQNLHWSGMEPKAWLSQFRYTVSADESHKILTNLFRSLINTSSYGRKPVHEREQDTVTAFYRYIMEGTEARAKEAAAHLSNAIGYLDESYRVEGGTELLWAIAKGFTFNKREWVPVVKEKGTKAGSKKHVLVYATTDNPEFPETRTKILGERRDQLEALGYQFVKLGKGYNDTFIFGPSGSPVVLLDRYEGYICPAKEQYGSRPLGWQFISTIANAAMPAWILNARAKSRAMSEFKRIVPDRLQSLTESDEEIFVSITGKIPFIKVRQFFSQVKAGAMTRSGKRTKIR